MQHRRRDCPPRCLRPDKSAGIRASEADEPKQEHPPEQPSPDSPEPADSPMSPHPVRLPLPVLRRTSHSPQALRWSIPLHADKVPHSAPVWRRDSKTGSSDSPTWYSPPGFRQAVPHPEAEIHEHGSEPQSSPQVHGEPLVSFPPELRPVLRKEMPMTLRKVPFPQSAKIQAASTDNTNLFF